VARRTPLKLEAVAEPANPAAVEPTLAGVEPVTTLSVRVPWSVVQKLRGVAHERSQRQQRRVTLQELVAEAIDKLASENA
jgi:hypothetical protein